MRHPRLAIAVLLAALPAYFAPAADYHVCAATGNDASSGRAGSPLKTISKAVSLLKPGDSCLVRAGTYRESVEITSSGTKGRPITIAGADGVVIDGRDPLTLDWQPYKDRIYVADCPVPVEQMFSGNTLLPEARWPNMRPDESWAPEKKFALTDKGSEVGKVISKQLADMGIDLSGARMNIRIGKGQNHLTRDVTQHSPGSAEIFYDQTALETPVPPWFLREDLDPVKLKRFGLHDNRFYMEGAASLIDMEGEWAYEKKTGKLYLYPPTAADPATLSLSHKARERGVFANEKSFVSIKGMTFIGCAVEFTDSHDCVIDSIRSFQPTSQQYFSTKECRETRGYLGSGVMNSFEGKRIAVRNSEFAYALMMGVVLHGEEMVIENCVVHNADLIGEHSPSGIQMLSMSRDRPCVVRRNTVFNCGGCGVRVNRYATLFEYNHIFNVGLYCHDVSALYIPVYGHNSEIRYNWVHDIPKISYRVDTLGDNVAFHHNVSWNSTFGFKFQGVRFHVYNNTILAPTPTSSMVFVHHPPADTEFDPVTMANRVFNNIGYFINTRGGKPIKWVSVPDSDRASHNVRLSPTEDARAAVGGRYKGRAVGYDAFERHEAKDVFVDFGNLDLLPREGSVCSRGKGGDYPAYAGAYEPDGEVWVPGATWMPGTIKRPMTFKEATDLAKELLDVQPATVVDERVESRL